MQKFEPGGFLVNPQLGQPAIVLVGVEGVDSLRVVPQPVQNFSEPFKALPQFSHVSCFFFGLEWVES